MNSNLDPFLASYSGFTNNADGTVTTHADGFTVTPGFGVPNFGTQVAEVSTGGKACPDWDFICKLTNGTVGIAPGTGLGTGTENQPQGGAASSVSTDWSGVWNRITGIGSNANQPPASGTYAKACPPGDWLCIRTNGVLGLGPGTGLGSGTEAQAQGGNTSPAVPDTTTNAANELQTQAKAFAIVAGAVLLGVLLVVLGAWSIVKD